jgi:hypothetical protein
MIVNLYGSSGHDGGTTSGQTQKKPKDLSVSERGNKDVGRVGVCILCVGTLDLRGHRNCHKVVSVAKKNHELVCM